MENKGQLKDEKNNILNDISYYGRQGGVNVYCKPTMISFVFTKLETTKDSNSEKATGSLSPAGGGRGWKNPKEAPHPSKITTARLDLLFLNANPKAQILPTDQQEYYENYYTTGDVDHGITNVHSYKTITYKNIYPNIDMVLKACPNSSSGRVGQPSSAKATAEKEGMEYSFVIYPGGNVKDIQMQWNGADSFLPVTKENPNNKITNSLGSITETGLKSYLEGSSQSISIGYSFLENKIGFDIGNYEKGKTLVIDPTLVWGTYFGGDSDEYALGISIDSLSNSYLTGEVNSITQFEPSRSSLVPYGGDGNVFLAKFNSAGNIVWTTYFGGDGEDKGNSICLSKSGNIYITGQTESTNGIATSGAYQTSMAGGNTYGDAFLAKFNKSGSLNWATYFGGEGDEFGAGVSVDTSENVYFTGSTSIVCSSCRKIATSGAYQTYNAGTWDVFLAKFSSSGSIFWATYYGGTSVDLGYGVSIDASGNVYITGRTFSGSGIATSGAYKTFLRTTGYWANWDCFLAKFSSAGSLKWSTYFGGYADDFANGICADPFGNVYITGGTTGNSDSVATSGAFETSYPGGYVAFLAKFSGSGSLTWSTYYGNEAEVGNSVCSDKNGNIYLAGTSNSPSKIANSCAYQINNGGSYDAFLAKFNSSGKRIWGTYFGGTSKDAATSLSADNAGYIYMTGFTFSSSSIATSGAYQTSLKGSVDAFLAKFSYSYENDAGISNVLTPNGNLCPGTYDVNVQLNNYGSIDLKTAKIEWSINSKAQTSYNWTGDLTKDSSAIIKLGTFKFDTGTDTIRAWTILPNGVFDSFPCNDSSTIIETVNNPPTPNTGGDHSICSGGHIFIGSYPISGHIYSWASNPTGFTSNISDPYAAPSITTTYYLTESTKGANCTSRDSITITVNSLPILNANRNNAICQGDSVSIGSPVHQNYTYSWLSDPAGFSSTSSNPTVNPSVTSFYYLAESDTITGCKNVDTTKITINSLPTPNAGGNQTICSGTSISLGTSYILDHRYLWKSNPIGITDTNSNIIVNPTVSTTYYLTESIAATGCSKSDSAIITVKPSPKVTTGGNKTQCPRSSTTIGDSAVSGNSYLWSSKPSGFSSTLSNPIVSPKVFTTYYLTETNTVTGCSATDSLTVRPLSEIYDVYHAQLVTLNQSICSGDRIQLVAYPPSFKIEGYYDWESKSSGWIGSNENLFVRPTSTTIYYLISYPVYYKQCVSKDSVTITVNPLPKPDAGRDTNICLGNQIIPNLTPINGHSYSWSSNPTGFVSTSSNPTLIPTSRTIYYLTETIDSTGCKKSDSVVIKVKPLPLPNAGKNQFICPGQFATFGFLDSLGDNYHWSSLPVGFNATQPEITVSPTISTRYILTEKSPYTGCSNSDTTNAFVMPKPNTNIKGPDMICGDDSAIKFQVDSLAGSSWKWAVKGGTLLSGQNTSSILAKLNYGTDSVIVTETNSFGCSATASKNIRINLNPDAHFKVLKDSPAYIYTALDSNEQYYSWILGDGTTGSLYKITHQYPFKKDTLLKVSLTVGNAFGCSSIFDTIINIHYFPAPFFNIKIFPNPFENITYVGIELEKPAHIQIIVYDAIGRLITKLADAEQNAGSHTYTLDADKYQLSAGVYFLKILVDDKMYVKAIIRQ